MEKYYLSSLTDCRLNHEQDLEGRRARLVEVEFARKPPSIGIIYLTSELLDIRLSWLEFVEQKNVRFKQLATKFKNNQPIVDFDTNDAILIDNSPVNQPVQCIALQADGNLWAVQLRADDDTTCRSLISSVSELSLQQAGAFVQCKLQQLRDQSYAHLLREKCYYCYKISDPDKLELVSKFEIPRLEASKIFRRLHLMKDLALITLNDFTCKIVHKQTCLASLESSVLNLADKKELLVLSAQSELVLVTLSTEENVLRAFSLQFNADSVPKRESEPREDDPDELLMAEPSFELELCWLTELNNIDCVRASNELEQTTESGFCPIWSPESSSSWPKFLLVACKFHLLVFSFEQQQAALPFSVVYDKSFLKPASEGDQQKAADIYSDLKRAPKLVQTFKLIGAQPTDGLFNSFFLAARIELVQLHHFNQLSLILALSNRGDVFAFKITSSKVFNHKDNLYQQQVAECLRGGLTLLRDTIEQLNKGNSQLKEDILSLESNGDKQQTADEEKLLKAELKQQENIGCLYDLRLTLSNLVQVSQIVVVSTVHSFILEPTSGTNAILSIQIDNNCKRTPVVKSKGEATKLADDERLKTWAQLELNHSSRHTSITLPVFILDNQWGQIQVFFLLSSQSIKPVQFQAFSRKTYETFDENISGFLLRSLKITPLMSYKRVLSSNLNSESNLIKIVGLFSRDQMINWLNDCFHIPNNEQELNLHSSFTRCSIKYDLRRNQEISISGDDVIALELIKKHILKKATSVSMKLEVSRLNPSTSNLRHLLSEQFHNLSKLKVEQNTQDNNEQRVALLMDSLFSEVDSNELPQELNGKLGPDWLDQSFRADITALVSSNITKEEKNDNTSSLSVIQTTLIHDFIVDALIKFETLQLVISNQTPATNDNRICSMRSRMAHIYQNSASERSFVDQVLNEWNMISKG